MNLTHIQNPGANPANFLSKGYNMGGVGGMVPGTAVPVNSGGYHGSSVN